MPRGARLFLSLFLELPLGLRSMTQPTRTTPDTPTGGQRRSPTTGLAGRSVLSIADLKSSEIRGVLDLAKAIKQDYARWKGAMEQKSAVLLFEKPSLRTRVSFEIGVAKLGGTAVYLDHQHSPIGERETVHDYGRNLERWADCIVARVFRHATLEALRAATKVPVINALSETDHPCQALADALTLEEHGVSLDSMKLAWIGDGNNVCHSLIELAAAMGGSITVVTPRGYEPSPKVVASARTLAIATGATITLSNDPLSVRGADAVYTDTWISMGEQKDPTKLASMQPFQVNAALMGTAGPKTLFMHCLPAHRGEEVTDEVIDGPRSIVFDQAENRLHAQNALLMQVLGLA
jgi:ornithine carbamoyltransferase